MPQNAPIEIGAEWELLTDANVSEVTFQNIGSSDVHITATNGTTAPALSAEGFRYAEGQGEMKRALADLFPGVSGANRLWARATSASTTIFISHA